MTLQIKSNTKQINILLFTLLFFAVVTTLYNAKTRNDLTISKKNEISNIIQIKENDQTPNDQKEEIKVGNKSNFTIYDNRYSILGENTRFDKEVIDTNIPFYLENIILLIMIKILIQLSSMGVEKYLLLSMIKKQIVLKKNNFILKALLIH